MSDNTLKTALARALLGKLVIHKQTGVFGEPDAVYAPGECPPNQDPALPTPTDVFVIQFREGHKFSFGVGSGNTDDIEKRVTMLFDVLTDGEKHYVHAALGAVNMVLREIGALAKISGLTAERATALSVRILRESARVLEQ